MVENPIGDVLQGAEEFVSSPEVQSGEFITPSLVGTVNKRDKKWMVTTPIPSIEYAQIIKSLLPEKFRLVRGQEVEYDMLTKIGEENNRNYAINVHSYKRIRK
jgi:hypothetical protein